MNDIATGSTISTLRSCDILKRPVEVPRVYQRSVQVAPTLRFSFTNDPTEAVHPEVERGGKFPELLCLRLPGPQPLLGVVEADSLNLDEVQKERPALALIRLVHASHGCSVLNPSPNAEEYLPVS